MGCIGQVGPDAYNARRVALAAGLPENVPAYTVNRLCGSGLQAIWSAAMQMRWGGLDIALAGGDESMTRMPFYDFGARNGYKLGDRDLVDGTVVMLTDPFNDIHMGVTAENVAAQVRRQSRRAGRVRGRVPAPGRHRRGAGPRSPRRSCPSRSVAAARHGDRGRAPQARHHPGDARDAAPRVRGGRHRHGRQRLGHQRRRRGGGPGPRVGRRRARPHRPGDPRGRDHRSHGTRTDGIRPRPRAAEAVRADRHDAGRHRRRRAERGVRCAGRRRASATRSSTRRRSTRTAAPSRSATRSAPPARS